MKTKALWLLALGLGILCVWMVWSYAAKMQSKTVVGVQSGAVVFAVAPLPVLHWGELAKFGDLGLKVKAKDFINLSTTNLEETVRFNGLTYTQIQLGMFLVQLNDQRIYVFADPFEVANLNPKQAVAFKSDWVVLQRSSLLPENWPEPTHGWVVLGSQISENLKTLSLDNQKPVVRPSNQGTVWLEKKLESDWQVVSP